LDKIELRRLAREYEDGLSPSLDDATAQKVADYLISEGLTVPETLLALITVIANKRTPPGWTTVLQPYKGRLRSITYKNKAADQLQHILADDS